MQIPFRVTSLTSSHDTPFESDCKRPSPRRGVVAWSCGHWRSVPKGAVAASTPKRPKETHHMATAMKQDTPASPPLDLKRGGEGWRPKPGAEVRGILRSINRGWSDWADNYYPILTIEQDDGKLVDVHCFHAVLLNRVLTLKPNVGEYVGVKFHGQE